MLLHCGSVTSLLLTKPKITYQNCAKIRKFFLKCKYFLKNFSFNLFFMTKRRYYGQERQNRQAKFRLNYMLYNYMYLFH